jgi:hypothetical protein
MRHFSTLLLAVLTATVLVASAASAVAAPIVGGPADPYFKFGGLRGTRGFGQVKPREIFYGGDESGLVCHIRWKTWGGATAVGYGDGWYVGSHQSTSQGHQAVAILNASHLGTWRGKSAYLKLTWSFPQNGDQRLSDC